MTSVAAVELRQNTLKLVRTALAVALMYLGLLAVQFSPTGDAFFFAATAVVLMSIVLLNGLVWGSLAFVALGILAFTTLGPALIWPFFLAYGFWVFIKIGIEWLCFKKSWPLWRDYVLKLIAAVLFAVLARFILAKLLLGQAFTALSQKYGAITELWPIALVLLILLYDYFLSVAKNFLVRDIFPHLKINK